MKYNVDSNRRSFFKKSALLTAGLTAVALAPGLHASPYEEEDSIYLIGPQDGYTPRIGTLLSTMTMMRVWVVDQVQDLTVEQLDFQLDDKSNSIGAMLLHLAATERYYQLNTFDEMDWGTWNNEIKEEWDVPMNLGEQGRTIKGHDISYYLTKLEEVRDQTKREFSKRDDNWLMKSEPFFGNQPTNNHCKWFHVCEHESNHNGQIKFVKARFPE